MYSIKDLQLDIQSIIEKFVDKPQEIEAKIVMSTTSIILQVSAAREDFGKIIGKQGKNIESLKTIATAIKNTQLPKDYRKIDIEILDGEVPSYTIPKRV